MVSAWATSNQLVLGQRKVDEKSNEITAILALLRSLLIRGCIVTIDAMARGGAPRSCHIHATLVCYPGNGGQAMIILYN